jgi:predicted nuclease of predicted toxin-antitoxin system
MKLLFDAMLSPRLAGRVQDIFEESSHVDHFGLQNSDTSIWEFARDAGFTTVTKDNDFQ